MYVSTIDGRVSKHGAMNTAVPNRFFDELGLPTLKE
jgi:hypothetical protein